MKPTLETYRLIADKKANLLGEAAQYARARRRAKDGSNQATHAATNATTSAPLDANDNRPPVEDPIANTSGTAVNDAADKNAPMPGSNTLEPQPSAAMERSADTNAQPKPPTNGPGGQHELDSKNGDPHGSSQLGESEKSKEPRESQRNARKGSYEPELLPIKEDPPAAQLDFPIDAAYTSDSDSDSEYETVRTS